MSYSRLFNERSVGTGDRSYVDHDPAKVGAEREDHPSLPDKDKIRHLQLSMGGNAEAAGLQDLNNAPDETKRDSNNKKKDEETIQRQIMLNNLLQDLLESLARIQAAIEATEKIKKLLKKKKFDVEDPDHFQLLITAGIHPESVANGELTEEFLNKHEDNLREQSKDFKASYEQAKQLDPNDPRFYQKAHGIQNVGVRDNKQEAYHLVVYGSKNDPKTALSSVGFSKDEQDDFMNESFSDDFCDDFTSSKTPISAASTICGQSIQNAPALQSDFVAAVKPDPNIQQQAPIPDQTIATETITSPMKLG